MNLHQLRYVVATADHGTMTAAAAACHVAQPALTRAVRSLERELGLTLFARRGRSVELTPDGHRILPTARSIIDGVDSISGLGRLAAARTLTLATTPTIQSDLGAGLVQRFWAHHPDVAVRIVTCDGNTGVGAAVAEGRADAGLTILPVVGALHVRPFDEREVVVMAPPGSDLPEPVTLGDLAGVPLVLPSPGSLRRSELEQGLAAAGVVPRVAFESDDRTTWPAAVLAGVGCCLWYRSRAEDAERHGARLLRFEPRRIVTVAAVHRSDPNVPTRAFLDVVDELAAEAGLTGGVRP